MAHANTFECGTQALAGGPPELIASTAAVAPQHALHTAPEPAALNDVQLGNLGGAAAPSAAGSGAAATAGGPAESADDGDRRSPDPARSGSGTLSVRVRPRGPAGPSGERFSRGSDGSGDGGPGKDGGGLSARSEIEPEPVESPGGDYSVPMPESPRRYR